MAFSFSARLLSLTPLLFCACSEKRASGESCGFDGWPVALNEMSRLDPLGSLDPAGGRPLPSAALRAWTTNTDFTVRSPGALKVKRVESFANGTQRLTLSGANAGCGANQFTLDWSGELEESLAAIAASADEECVTPNGGTRRCSRALEVWLGAGETLGRAHGGYFELAAYGSDTNAALLGASARYPNVFGLSELMAFCPLDALSEATRTELAAKIRSAAGVARDGAPACGEFALDASGKLSGNWFSTGGAVISFAKDPFVTATPRISARGQTSLSSGAYTFATKSSGFRNRAFADVTNDGKYCYDELSLETGGTSLGIRLVVEMTDAQTLKVEKQDGACPGARGSLAFTEAVGYAR